MSLTFFFFSGEEPKAQRGEVNFPRSHSWGVMKSELTPRTLPRVLGSLWPSLLSSLPRYCWSSCCGRRGIPALEKLMYRSQQIDSSILCQARYEREDSGGARKGVEGACPGGGAPWSRPPSKTVSSPRGRAFQAEGIGVQKEEARIC